MASVGFGAAQTHCNDFSDTQTGTTTGVPDESVTGTSVEADEYVYTLGSSSCEIRTLTVETTTSDAVSDFDLDVDFEGITVEHSATASGNERVFLQGPPVGEYTVRVKSWLTESADYTLTVTADLEANDGVSAPNADDEAVVIAVVDTGINPYHEEFLEADGNGNQLYPGSLDLSEHPANYIEGYPDEATRLDLTLDTNVDYQTSVNQDNWDNVDEKELYWIPGTKIIGAYAGGGAFGDDVTILDENGHGTASAAVAAGNTAGTCDRCLLVAVEGTGGLDWAMAQPWIDLVSNSWSNRGNLGIPTAGQNDVDPAFGISGNEIAKESRIAVERGQTVLFAAGNGMANAFLIPQTTYQSAYQGPDWIMTIGAITKQDGGSGSSHENAILASGKPVDVSSFSVGDIPAAPHNSKTGDDQHGGTSAATPIVAGVMGQTLLDVREALGDTVGGNDGGVIASGTPAGGLLADGDLTRAELEKATKFSAEHTQSNFLGIYPVSPPGFFIPSDKLWTMWGAEGWGVVRSDTGQTATDFILGNQNMPTRAMDQAIADYDERNREALWGPAVAP